MKRIIMTAAAVIALAGVALPLTASAGDVHHPDCPGLVKDIAPGAPTPIGGTVYVKAGPNHYNVGFQAAGYVAGPQGGHDVSHVDVCPSYNTTTTTTTQPSTTTTTVAETTTTTTEPTTTTEATTTTDPGTTTTQPEVTTSTTIPQTTSTVPTGSTTTTPEQPTTTVTVAPTTTVPTTTEPGIDFPLIASDCVDGRWIAMNLDTITVDVVQNGVTTPLAPNAIIHLTRGFDVFILDRVQPYAFQLIEPEDCAVPTEPEPAALPATR